MFSLAMCVTRHVVSLAWYVTLHFVCNMCASPCGFISIVCDSSSGFLSLEVDSLLRSQCVCLHMASLAWCDPSLRSHCVQRSICNIILNNVCQHNFFITQGNYIGYMFRLLISRLQAYFVNCVTRCYAHIGIPSCLIHGNISMNVNTVGSLCVHSIL